MKEIRLVLLKSLPRLIMMLVVIALTSLDVNFGLIAALFVFLIDSFLGD